MCFNRPVTYCKTTAIAAGVCASPDVRDGQLRGRHTLTITAGSSAVYIGGDTNVGSNNGIKLASGESMTIPVATDRTDQVYVSGACVITEWF